MEMAHKDKDHPTICLNMIVKNESNILYRLFDSVIKWIDCYCICDTGSTDDTVNKIAEYFESKKIPGKIVVEPFKDFSHNRNFSLQACNGMSDYVLLLDADMVFCPNENAFSKKMLTHDVYYIFQGSNDFYYKNLRIVKNNGYYSYVGVTHEYVNFPQNTVFATFEKNVVFIDDVGDGGSKGNKYVRDVELLTRGIAENPKNDRYHFYLANTFKDMGKNNEAIEMYKRRIALGGWNQEIWQSYYKIGTCYKNLGKMPEALDAWLMAYNILPNRAENLYEIISYYRVNSKHKLGYIFYEIAKDAIENATDKDTYLFLENNIYTYKIDYEYTILAAYLGIQDINDEIITILNNSTDTNINRNLLQNMKFYKCILTPVTVVNMSNATIKNINNTLTKFNSSSSCLIPNKDGGYTMNVRYVNYTISQDGSYLNCDKHIVTLNKLVTLDNNFHILNEKWIPFEFEDRRYIGIEDVRIFPNSNNDNNDNTDNNDNIKIIGTGYHKNDTIGIVSGDYNVKTNKCIYNEINPSFNNAECEKNWVFVDYKQDTHIIYKWHPLQICKIDETPGTLTLIEQKQMPRIFTNARGSTCGYKYVNVINLDNINDNSGISFTLEEKEIWFIVHLVSYETPRHYYHMFVVFDSNLHLLRYSAPFVFEGQQIEYCLSLVVENERVIVNYSDWDRTTKIAIYDKKYIDSIIIYN
jgi:tetratricopeptide (TPR) repeat protein